MPSQNLCHNVDSCYLQGFIMYKKIVLACLLAVFSAAVFAKSGYYRWLDEEGRPQFTQKPPVNRPYTFIQSNVPYNRDDVNPEYPQTNPPKRAESAPNQGTEKKFEVLPDKDPGRCAQARKALASFARGQRVRVTDESGESRVLNSEEQAQQEEKARELVDIYC